MNAQNRDATREVNRVARGLQEALAEFGHDVTEHEAQALAVCGLLAAAQARKGWTALPKETEHEAQALAVCILDADPKNQGGL